MSALNAGIGSAPKAHGRRRCGIAITSSMPTDTSRCVSRTRGFCVCLSIHANKAPKASTNVSEGGMSCTRSMRDPKMSDR